MGIFNLDFLSHINPTCHWKLFSLGQREILSAHRVNTSFKKCFWCWKLSSSWLSFGHKPTSLKVVEWVCMLLCSSGDLPVGSSRVMSRGIQRFCSSMVSTDRPRHSSRQPLGGANEHTAGFITVKFSTEYRALSFIWYESVVLQILDVSMSNYKLHIYSCELDRSALVGQRGREERGGSERGINSIWFSSGSVNHQLWRKRFMLSICFKSVTPSSLTSRMLDNMISAVTITFLLSAS